MRSGLALLRCRPSLAGSRESRHFIGPRCMQPATSVIHTSQAMVCGLSSIILTVLCLILPLHVLAAAGRPLSPRAFGSCLTTYLRQDQATVIGVINVQHVLASVRPGRLSIKERTQVSNCFVQGGCELTTAAAKTTGNERHLHSVTDSVRLVHLSFQGRGSCVAKRKPLCVLIYIDEGNSSWPARVGLAGGRCIRACLLPA